MELKARIIAKTERLFRINGEVVPGWQIQLEPLEDDPAGAFAGTQLTTVDPETASRYRVGEDVTVSFAAAPPRAQIVLPHRN